MSDAPRGEMPRYKCYKEVHALKIFAVEPTGTDGTRVLCFEQEKGFAPIRVTNEYVRKHDPQPGGYYVVYKDGYLSFSPAKAFEEGYTRV